MSFTDQNRRVATDEECHRQWGGEPDGKRFRCGLCGHRFKAGDGWRWVYGDGRGFETDGKKWGVTNFLTCDSCDGEDILDRWIERHREFYADRFWSFH